MPTTSLPTIASVGGGWYGPGAVLGARQRRLVPGGDASSRGHSFSSGGRHGDVFAFADVALDPTIVRRFVLTVVRRTMVVTMTAR